MMWNLFFRWFDLWIGAYVDVPGKALYVCPIPMFGIRIRWGLTLGDVMDEDEERRTGKKVEPYCDHKGIGKPCCPVCDPRGL